jgi:5-deoxy-glucuronate isomerase
VSAGLHRRAAELGREPWACEVTPEDAGWAYSGLRVLELPPGGAHSFHTGPDEVLLLPLAGAATVRCGAAEARLAGRRDVWSGPTDFAYLPPGEAVEVSSVDGGRFALPSARAAVGHPFRVVAAADVPVELRGAGSCSRQVHNFGTPQTLAADRVIACEVLTPGGNWSSYPPHKHDEDRPGESALEEVYYFEVARGGPAYQRVYGSVDLLAEVRTGDVVLIPRGWHGQSMAAPGYDLYYLNVMAGPGERAWRISDDPDHAWVRQTWPGQPVDPRLPWRPA